MALKKKDLGQILAFLRDITAQFNVLNKIEVTRQTCACL